MKETFEHIVSGVISVLTTLGLGVVFGIGFAYGLSEHAIIILQK